MKKQENTEVKTENEFTLLGLKLKSPTLGNVRTTLIWMAVVGYIAMALYQSRVIEKDTASSIVIGITSSLVLDMYGIEFMKKPFTWIIGLSVLTGLLRIFLGAIAPDFI